MRFLPFFQAVAMFACYARLRDTVLACGGEGRVGHSAASLAALLNAHIHEFAHFAQFAVRACERVFFGSFDTHNPARSPA